jgi:hypothetical protein
MDEDKTTRRADMQDFRAETEHKRKQMNEMIKSNTGLKDVDTGNVMTAIRNTYTTSSQFYKMMLNLTEEEETIKQNLKKNIEA